MLQPALGLGIASSKAARPLQARAKSVGTHIVFGLGLYFCAVGCASFGWPTTRSNPPACRSTTMRLRPRR
ncbi:MAG: DUF2938 family protein [Gemmatimonadota bacterium]